MRRFLFGLAALGAIAFSVVAFRALASDWYLFDLAPAGSSVRSCGTYTMPPGGAWEVWCTAAANINTHCTDIGCASPSCTATASNHPLAANTPYQFQQAPNEAGIAIIGTATCHVSNHWPPGGW